MSSPPFFYFSRDVKPANIFVLEAVTPEGNKEVAIKICDFGLSTLKDPGMVPARSASGPMHASLFRASSDASSSSSHTSGKATFF